ncbi:hypothetical protein [Noviherbaspirillum pedocola]|uniref:Uncharacterized protein n=1 Tax=Noviherbaspirillum pedocola TaxID=2801341 RepID=A0A934W8L6_9BURK|nr:hypothetical protein [Noviherbaspirillum pedocola]MBK4735969.1 hypothetical protein [Noviherbaspirillum pedocola]
MKVLNQATKAANQRVLTTLNSNDKERFSRYPVHEAEFWAKVFGMAADRKTAEKVLEEMGVLENEPCADNDRIYRCIETAKQKARRTLASH